MGPRPRQMQMLAMKVNELKFEPFDFSVLVFIAESTWLMSPDMLVDTGWKSPCSNFASVLPKLPKRPNGLDLNPLSI